MNNLEDKVFEGIISWFKDKNQKAIVALSGGVDSAVVALAAKKALDKKAIAVTADYNTLSADELKSARKIAKEINIEHKIIRYNELENAEFVKNDLLRCYHCRSELASYLLHEAKIIDVVLVVDGTNIDDLKDYRPGMKALRENGIRSPLVELGIDKNNVRSIAQSNNLSVFDKPSNSCLASRIPYGSPVTFEKLKRIENAEFLVKSIFNVRQVRVRDHQDLARIEVGKEEIKEMFDTKKLSEIDSKLKHLGFKHIALDLSGYKSRENINTSSSNNTN
ncbi:MAG TPA: ATP-dependent sacrificial sulfur transferase LarE [Nitrososphaeraceae archaeon]|jgi:pyridinium-3,5-biscarboxylic acid mononucleotide sulfurtransferase|nr:ATP-dependent sacrificial sulfur transferase LarE [Nitrososphaeraceae archaeon]